MTYISTELRRFVVERAGNCCEYCLLSQENNFLPFEVDHIISEKHSGETSRDNLCLSCVLPVIVLKAVILVLMIGRQVGL